MTEYDYSPDAYERHLATQEKIARWVDQTLEQSPCDPFALLPSEEFDRSQTPQRAFRATPQGDISPMYSNHSRRHEQSQWNSPSQRSSTSSTSLMMPQPRPHLGRSFTSPSASQFLPQASKPYPPPSYPSYTLASPPPTRIPSPYNSRSQHQPPPMPHRSSSRNSFHSVHSPRIHASPVIQQQHGGNIYPYFSPSHQQPVHQQPVHPSQQQQHVVVLRGVTVVPPPGHHIEVLVRFLSLSFSLCGDLFYCLESKT